MSGQSRGYPFKPIDVEARNTEVLPEEAAERPPFLFWVPLVVCIILNGAAITHQVLTIAHFHEALTIGHHFLQDNHCRRDNIFAI